MVLLEAGVCVFVCARARAQVWAKCITTFQIAFT